MATGEGSKVISAGVLVRDGRGAVLLAHPTGAGVRSWNLPKGKVEEGEDARAAALRELFEEANVILNEDELRDLGVYAYTKAKDLHLFSTECLTDLPVESIRCRATFKVGDAREIPEMDRFAWVMPQDLDQYCQGNMLRVLKEAFDRIEERVAD